MLAAASLHAWGGALDAALAVRLGAHVPRARRGLVLRLVDASGAVGWGEATPLDDTELPATLDALQAHDYAATVLPATPHGLASTHALTTAPEGAARFAIEAALCDLAAQRDGVSLSRWLAPGHTARVPRSAYVGADDDPATARRAEAAIARGVCSVKLKSRGGAALFERLDELAEILRGHVALRIDFNGALSTEEATTILPRLAARAVALVEEPLSGSALAELTSPVPIYADESVPAGLSAILASARLAGVVLKPTRDGLAGCLDIAAAARTSGKRVIVTHAFEGPIALAHVAHVALALTPAEPDDGGHDPAPGVDRHEALAAFPSLPLPILDSDPAALVASSAPGLGVAPDALPLAEALWRWTR